MAAGTLAALNPCGFALLPVYLVRVLGGGDAADPVIELAGDVQGWLAGAVDRLGVAAVAAGFLAIVAAAAAIARRWRRTRPPDRVHPPP